MRLTSLLKHTRLVTPLATHQVTPSICHPLETTAVTSREKQTDAGYRTNIRGQLTTVLGGDSAAASRKAAILAKVEVIHREDDCAKIVQRILSLGEPIAVDMEGVQLPVLGLIQVKTAEDKIYLFRTGRNKKLFVQGRLKDLFESTSILKILHASTGDCLAIYREGVRMWNLFDTSIAHRVIEYQNNGTSLQNQLVSFNHCCKIYGMEINPLKDKYHGQLWKYDGTWSEKETLNESLIYYSACDVEPLLDLYRIMSVMIEPDFYPLFQDLCDNELIRCIDLDLFRIKQKARVSVEGSDVFLSNIGDRVAKPDVYSLIASFDGYKKVLFSDMNQTAHIIVSDRQQAVLMHKALANGSFPEPFNKQMKVKLLVGIQDEEVELSETELRKFKDRMRAQNIIVEPSHSAQIVDVLRKVKCPVVVDFHEHTDGVTMDMFVGRYPTIKFAMTKEMILTGKLAELLGDPAVVKVVARLDTSNTASALKLCTLLAPKTFPKNFFDVATVGKLPDYWQYGQSIYKTTIPNLRDLKRRLGIFFSTQDIAHARLEGLMYIHLYLKSLLPLELLAFADAKSKVDLDVAVNNDLPAAKEARKQLRAKYESFCAHVACVKGPSIKLGKILTKALDDEGFEYKRVTAVGRYAFVEFEHHPDIREFVSKFNGKTVDGLSLKASDVDLKIIDRGAVKKVNILSLDRANVDHLENLKKNGFFSIVSTEEDPAKKKRNFSSLGMDEYKTVS